MQWGASKIIGVGIAGMWAMGRLGLFGRREIHITKEDKIYSSFNYLLATYVIVRQDDCGAPVKYTGIRPYIIIRDKEPFWGIGDLQT